ncbi:MAG: FHA domain-containing protein [Acidobacteriota bacterium]
MTLAEDRVTLGRSTQNQLSYPDDVGLSRQHLALTRIDGQWVAEDLGSKNGTLLNGDQLKKPTPFLPGDRLAAVHLHHRIRGSRAGRSKHGRVHRQRSDSKKLRRQ